MDTLYFCELKNSTEAFLMPRPKKIILTPEEQLEKLISDIEAAKATLKEMEQQKKVLEVQIKMNRLSELDELITASGKSFDDVKALLNGNGK